MAKAIIIAESLVDRYPADTSIRQTAWRVFILTSSIYEGTRNDLSLKFAQKAMRTAETAVNADAADTQARHNLARSFSRMGIVSALLDKIPEAAGHLKNAEVLLTELIEKEPKNRLYQNDLGKLFTRFGDIKEKQGDLRGALQAFEKSIDLFEAIALADMKNTLARRDLAQSLKSAGKICLTLGESENAKQQLLRARAILNELKTQNALGKFDKQLADETETALQGTYGRVR